MPQRRTLAHPCQRIQRIGAHGLVGQCFGGGLQRLENRYPCANQHGQRGGKARTVVVARQPAHQRQTQPAGVKTDAQRRPLQCRAQAECGQQEQRQHHHAPVTHQRAERQQRRRQPGQGSLAAGKHRRHLRHHVAQQKNHDDQRHQRHDGRVQRGAH